MSSPSAFEIRDGTFAMIRDGGYELSGIAKTIYWFLLFHGIWQPGHEWFSHVDIKMTANSVIQMATGWSESSVRRGLTELEEKEFVARKKRFIEGGVRVNDSIKITYPGDWCSSCHKRGKHMCDRGV